MEFALAWGHKMLMSPNHRRRRLSGCKQGQAAVETAISIVLFLTVLLGIIEFARAMYSFDQVSEAAKLGVRYAIVHGSQSSTPATSSDVKSYILNQVSGLDPKQLTVNTNWQPDNNPGGTVTVQVLYNFRFAETWVPRMTLTLSGNSEGVIAQ